jgi:hypothetical protein
VQFDAPSSFSQHVLDHAKILGLDVFFYLLPRQPLEVAQTEEVPYEIRLTSHDSRFHEEGSRPLSFQPVIHVVRVHDMVPDRSVADDPGIHIYARTLNHHTFRGLILPLAYHITP